MRLGIFWTGSRGWGTDEEALETEEGCKNWRLRACLQAIFLHLSFIVTCLCFHPHSRLSGSHPTQACPMRTRELAQAAFSSSTPKRRALP